jgi:hypothetical protein
MQWRRGMRTRRAAARAGKHDRHARRALRRGKDTDHPFERSSRLLCRVSEIGREISAAAGAAFSRVAQCDPLQPLCAFRDVLGMSEGVLALTLEHPAI